MFDGKEKKLSLIEELLIVSNIKNINPEQEIKTIENIRKDKKENAILDEVMGQLIVYNTQILTEEFVRQKDIQEINQFKK